MDAQIDRHQPLITARLVFVPKAFPPPPIISARMEFPSINVLQQYERSPTPEVRIPRKHLSITPRRAPTPTRRPTPINTQKSVAFNEVDINLESPLTSVSGDSDDEPESEEDGEASTRVPKPQGQPGRPQSGGYKLQDKLGWNDTTYESIQSLVHKQAKTKLDTAKSFRGQDMKKIKQICDAVSQFRSFVINVRLTLIIHKVRKEYPILKDYIRDWPTRDMLKLHLKYTSETTRRSAVASRAKKIEKVC